MNVENVMTRAPRSCRRTDSLATAAKILWDHDCGVVPVVDDQNRPVGMLTDRDCLMASFTRGRKLDELSVQSAMAHLVFSIGKDQPATAALLRMQEHQVRRLPVIDSDGKLCGIVALADLAQRLHRGFTPQQVAEAVAAIAAPRAAAKAPTNAGAQAKADGPKAEAPKAEAPKAESPKAEAAQAASAKAAPVVVPPAKVVAPAKAPAKKGKR